jgi:lipoprotein-releasing system permease protein
MLSLRVAARFLRKSPVQSALIIAGIGVGIATMVFVGSLIQSLQANLVDQTIGTGPQITIQAFKNGDPVVYSSRMQKLLANDPRVKQGAVAAVRVVSALWTNGTDSAPLNCIGASIDGINGIYKLDKLPKGHFQGTETLGPSDILLGRDFCDKYGIKVGDSVNLVFQGANSATFRVQGIYDIGAAAFNERNAFVNETVPQTLLGWRSDQYTAVYVQVTAPFTAGVTALQWRTQLDNVDVIDWQAQNANLLSALQSQSLSSYMIQAFVLVAVALGIASTLAISAVQKTRQIGILKAMGLSDRRSGLVFFFEALILGGLGSLLGIGMAFFFIWGFSFAPTPFSVVAKPGYVLFSAGIGIGVALLSSVVPIRRTSKLDPIEVIQSG